MSQKTVDPKALKLIGDRLREDLSNFKNFYTNFCTTHNALKDNPQYKAWYEGQRWAIGMAGKSRSLPNMMRTAAEVYSQLKAAACAGPDKANCCKSDPYLPMNRHCSVEGLPNIDLSAARAWVGGRRFKLTESEKRAMAHSNCETALGLPWRPRKGGGRPPPPSGGGGGGGGRTLAQIRADPEYLAMPTVPTETPLEDLLPSAPTHVPAAAPVAAPRRRVAIAMRK